MNRCLLLLILLAASHRLNAADDTCCPPSKQPDAHAGHGHDEPANLDEAANEPCEHKVPIFQCAECRYEAGLVKIDGSLWKNGQTGLLTTATVTTRTMREAVALTGEIRLNENTAAHMSPRVAGVIESVAVDLGAVVKPGDELFAITSPELGRAVADHQRAVALTRLAKTNADRERQLVAQKAGSGQDLVDAEMKYEEQRTALLAAEQQLAALGLDPAAASQLPTGRLATRAPSAGVVVEKHAVAGERAEPGRDVMLIADLATVWVWADVREKELASLVAAQAEKPVAVMIRVGAYPDRVFNGTIDYVGATMDERTRTVRVRATVANSGRLLKPGMFCRVEAALGADTETLAVPRAAIMTDEGRAFVFVRWKDDYFARRFIERGREAGGFVAVAEGVRAGETLVADGAFLLKSDVLREKMGAGCAD